MLKMPIFLILLLAPASAFAYLGPGMGGGAIAAILGLIGAILLGLFSVIYYPIKRLIKRHKASKETSTNKERGEESEGSEEGRVGDS